MDADHSESTKPTLSLDDLRARIDEIDSRLVEMLNDRAKLVVEVGKYKRGTGVPIYAPHREQAVLDKVLKASKGPLPPSAIEAVWRELMSGSFALELPLRIAYLGPAGSFSHQAAVKQFGSSVSFEDTRDIRAVVDEVARGHCHYGLVPIENSIGGGIVETLDAFRAVGRDIEIYAEVLIAVHHNLLANCEPGQVTRIHSKFEIFSQCRNWLSAQYPRAELITAPSSARAVQTVKEHEQLEPGSGHAAIGSTLAGHLYGVNVLFESIEDDPNNITRFFVISKEAARPSGDDKTSMMFTTQDKPGALVEVLQVYEKAGINLTHIDKRPSGRENWTYTFFVDAVGHRDDPKLIDATAEIATHCKDVVVLGSYPRAKRIL